MAREAGVVVTSISDFELAMTEALKKLTSAERAVQTLKEASKGSDENVAILSLALQGLQTANEAIGKLH